MALVIKDRVKESSVTTGTGSYTLAGAEAGFQTFAAIGDGNTTYYAAFDGTNWETGLGTYTASGTVLARTSIFSSSNSNSAVSWGAGEKLIFCTQPSSKAAFLDANNNLVDVGDVDGRNVSADGTKLDGIESSADVTDTANVTSAGALMDSEVANLAQVKAFSSADYATAAQGALANTSVQPNDNATLGNVSVTSLGVTGTVDGRDVAADGTKLDTVETNADVTDATNVTAAGALMDSELANLAAVKAINQSLVTTSSPTFAGLTAGGNISVTGTVDGRNVSADGTKLDYISVTQAVDLDQMEADVAALANGMVYKGDWAASSGSFPASGSAQIGWFYYVSVAGTVNSVAFNVGDNIVAIADNASTTTFAGNWSKHDNTAAVQSVVGLTGSITKSSLLIALNVENGADVTDATNVTAAGALMDSEVTNLAQVKAFSSSDYATAAQGTLAANALPQSGGALTGAVTTSSTFDGRNVSVDGAKLDNIEAGATADQTAAQIKTAYESNADTNEFSDAE